MIDFEKAFIKVKSWCEIWRTYHKNPHVLNIRYEDLMSEPIEILSSIMRYLNISVNQEVIENLLHKYSKDNIQANMQGLHFNKAIINRYKEELSETELTRFNDELGEQMIAMGYSLHT